MCGHMCVGEQKRVFHDDSSSVDLKKYGAKELIKVFLKQPDNVAWMPAQFRLIDVEIK